MRSKALIACLLCLASCAKWCETNEENNGSTNNATTAPTNNSTNAPVADCSGAALGQSVPFDAGGALPFSFEIHARFGNIDSSTATAVSGSTFNVVSAMPGDFEATYSVLREPIADANALQTEWESRNREPTTVTLDNSMLSAWRFESDERDAIYFMMPQDGEVYEATLEWTSPVGCVDERRALRDLATSTLSTVDETSFP